MNKECTLFFDNRGCTMAIRDASSGLGLRNTVKLRMICFRRGIVSTPISPSFVVGVRR